MNNQNLPLFFKPLMWSYRFNQMDVERDKHIIIVNAINYGDLSHWRWLAKTYGKGNLRKYIANIPASEFRPEVLKLLKALFVIKNMKYASYYDYHRSKKAFAKV